MIFPDFLGFSKFLTIFNKFECWCFFWIFGFFLDFFKDFFDFLDFVFILDFFFFWFFGIFFKVTKVTTESYQGYNWAPKIAKNGPKQHNRLSFFPIRRR